MSGIFVDTGAWFAPFVPTDPDHPAAKVWLNHNTSPQCRATRNLRMGQVVLLLQEGRDLKGLLRTRLYTAETEQKALASNPKS